jgi:hypothetical protein
VALGLVVTLGLIEHPQFVEPHRDGPAIH